MFELVSEFLPMFFSNEFLFNKIKILIILIPY